MAMTVKQSGAPQTLSKAGKVAPASLTPASTALTVTGNDKNAVGGSELYARLSKFDDFQKQYPMLYTYGAPIKPMTRPLIGRELQMQQMRAGLLRPELCNILLLGDAGSGKTALVQGTMVADRARIYLEIDISKMIADLRDNNEMAVKIKALFDEAAKFVKNANREIVMFIDEFHLICMLSNAAVEALKPMLADSGTRGVRTIVATTFAEFRQYVSANQPLVQRLQRIEVLPPEKPVVVQILKSFAKQYGVADKIPGDDLYNEIVDLSNKYIPANSQPRKSILLLDLMVGWQRANPSMQMDINLLHYVLKYSEGIELNTKVDAVNIKKRLDSKVFSQFLATSAVAARLQITSADLHNKTKPMASFLFTGSTGVGKALPDDTPIPCIDGMGHIGRKRNGDLRIGDRVFNQNGEAVPIIGVFPQGKQDVYEIEFTDGRVITCSGEHIWTYKSRFGNGSKFWRNITTKELMEKNSNKNYKPGRHTANIKYVIPMNKAVKYPERLCRLSPYVLGTMLGNSPNFDINRDFTIKHIETDISKRIVTELKAAKYEHLNDMTTQFVFELPNPDATAIPSVFRETASYRTLLEHMPELQNLEAREYFVPSVYKYSSIEQRTALIQGIFDTAGRICEKKATFELQCTVFSPHLAQDIQEILYSLGWSSKISTRVRRANKANEYFEFVITVLANHEDKEQFFSVANLKNIARRSLQANNNKQRMVRYGDFLGIRDIRKCDYQLPMTCILVDDEPHLYQAGDYIVTHNTELTKQLAEILFADPKRLIRFDMTEYSQATSVERFRTELTTKVWERPYSVILFDEIEKACGDVTRILLQVLDDGRLIDQNNREVSFLNTYIVLTTNAASEIYATIGDYVNDGSMSDEEQIKVLGRYMKVIRRAIVEGTGNNKFPPELLGRIDAICPFMPLNAETQKKILEKRMDKLADEVRFKHNLKLQYNRERILTYILGDKLDTESDSGGARIVASKFEEEVVIEVSRVINRVEGVSGSSLNGVKIGGIVVNVEGEMMAENKNLREGNASVVAYPVTIDGTIVKI